VGLEEEDDDDKRRSESEKEVDRSSYHQPSAIKSRQETARSTTPLTSCRVSPPTNLLSPDRSITIETINELVAR
jgi:hypothetical protein